MSLTPSDKLSRGASDLTWLDIYMRTIPFRLWGRFSLTVYGPGMLAAEHTMESM